MGTRHNGPLRGFGRFDRRFCEGNEHSDSGYTEAGPRPGVPVPRDGGRAMAHVSGAQTEDVDVRIQRQGYPGSDSATVAYRVGTETSDDDVRGWDPPNSIHESSVVEWTATNAYTVHDITTLPDSQRPVAIYADDDGEAWQVRTWSWTDNEWGDAVTPDSESTTAVDDDLPCAIVAIAEDHLLAMIVTGTSTPGSAILIRSSDQGATWRRVAEEIIDADETWSAKARMRYSQSSGQLLLAIPYEESGDWYIRQWASSDLSTFRHVGDLEVDTDGVFEVAVRATGGFALVYLDVDEGEIRQRRIGDAYDRFDRAPAEVVSDSRVVEDLCLSMDADGKLWMIGRDDARPDRWYQWVSVDSAASWTEMDMSAHDSKNTSQYATNLAATHAMGAMWVDYNPVSSVTPAVGGSLLTMVLGGWLGRTGGRSIYATDLLAGRQGTGHAPSASVASGLTLLPYEEVSTIIGVLTVNTIGGGGTQTVADGEVGLVTTATEAQYYTVSLSPGSRPRWRGLVRCDSGSSLGNWMRAWCKSGNLAIYVRYDRVRLEIYDNDITKIGDTIPLDVTAPLWIEVELGRDGAWVVSYWRPWETSVTSVTGTVAQVAGAGTEIGWGKTDVESTDSYFGPVLTSLHLLGADDSRFGIRTGSSVHGRPLDGAPYPIPDAGETDIQAASLRLTRGPATAGDVIDVDAQYDYPVSRIYPWSDPGLDQWRSQDTSEQIIDVELSGGDNSGLGSTSIVWPLIRVNFRTAHLESWDGSSWTTIATWDAATGFGSLTCDVDGDIVTPSSGTTAAGRYIQQAELAHGYLETSAGDVIEIARCEGGVWAGSSVTTKKVVLHVENRASESAVAGSCKLYAHSGVVVVHDIGVSGIERLRIRIPTQTTATGDFRAGMMTPGALKVIGRQWSADWTLSYEQQVEESGGGRRAHRRESLRPSPRVLAVSNTNGYLLHHLRGSNPSPNYLAADAGDPLEVTEAAPMLIAGLQRELEGDPTVIVTEVPTTDAVITDPTMWLYGHIVSSAGVDSVRGDEGVDEHLRVQSITMREITSTWETS